MFRTTPLRIGLICIRSCVFQMQIVILCRTFISILSLICKNLLYKRLLVLIILRNPKDVKDILWLLLVMFGVMSSDLLGFSRHLKSYSFPIPTILPGSWNSSFPYLLPSDFGHIFIFYQFIVLQAYSAWNNYSVSREILPSKQVILVQDSFYQGIPLPPPSGQEGGGGGKRFWGVPSSEVYHPLPVPQTGKRVQ